MRSAADATVAARRLVAARSVAAGRAARVPATPVELAARLISGYRGTPALSVISDVLHDAITGPDRRVIITTPPRTGKSVLVSQVGTLYALVHCPDTSVILASYSDSLAHEHSRAARALVAEHADLLGFTLSADKTSAARWKVDGRDGGLLAAGILSGLTGFGADLLLLDDPVKNAREADSAAQRRKILAEFRGTLMTRLHPLASVVIVGTRWSEDDLIGTLLRDEPDRWTHVNIPAVGEAGIPDALDRRPGAAMTSALGRTSEQFAELRELSGERSWYALFQGVPSSPAGGLVQREWLDAHRLPAAPPHPIRTVVAVDPADSGDRDAAGVIAASLGADGTVSVIADVSAHMTSEQWARAAIDLAVSLGASEIVVEAFAAGTTYVRVVKEALAATDAGRYVRVSGWPPKGSPRRGDALARSAPLLQALETGRARIAGHLPGLEEAAVSWQAGQHQPDALAATVIAFDTLAPVAGAQITLAAPVRSGSPQPPPAYLTRSVAGRHVGIEVGADDRGPAPDRLARSVRSEPYNPLAYLGWDR